MQSLGPGAASGWNCTATQFCFLCLIPSTVLSSAFLNHKLKYGHRGQNKPCINLDNNQVYVTSQNHGYGITPESLEKSDFDLWFANADDKTVEGIKHKTQNCVAVQFHP